MNAHTELFKRLEICSYLGYPPFMAYNEKYWD
ncbi:hypothetical protein NVP1081O_230 [Vibrio phage 1.081.O._10N.286.52.C2]|nr:hypothetical protein NVP1081O_230 [Vibrio phage 1.081.O._10N.286.52.C2]